MQETKCKCDFCRNPVSDGESVEVRINNKLHDLCKSCSGKLFKLLQGTGRSIPAPQAPIDWNKITNSETVTFKGNGGVIPITVPGQQPLTDPTWTLTTSGSNIQGNVQGVDGYRYAIANNAPGTSGMNNMADIGLESLSKQVVMLNSLFAPSMNIIQPEGV